MATLLAKLDRAVMDARSGFGRAVAPVLALACGALPAGCTFYSNCGDRGEQACPDQPAGTAGSDGNPGPIDEGVVSGDPPAGEWQIATGNLEGLNGGCGSMALVSAKPSEDLVIAAVSRNGLFASDDRGASWTPLAEGEGSDPIENNATQLVYDPDASDVFWEVGIYGSVGGYRTDDNGQTFERLGDLFHVETLAVDFSDSERKTMLTRTREMQSFLRSQDAGQTWVDITDSFPEESPTHCRIPVILDTNTWLLGCGSEDDSMPGILRTTDGGGYWSQVTDLPASESVPLRVGSTLYWVGEDGGLLQSDDDGQSFTEVAPGGTLSPGFGLLELNDGGLAGVSLPHLVVSSDRGAHFRRASPELPYTPQNFTYSPAQDAFYIWHSDCADALVLPDGIMRFDR